MRYVRDVRKLDKPIGHMMQEQTKFFVSLPSLTLCFHPNSRTFICLLLTYAKNRLSSSQKPTFERSTFIREMDTVRQKKPLTGCATTK